MIVIALQLYTRIVRFEFPCTISSLGCSVAVAQKKWTGPNVALKVFVFDVRPWARQDPQRPRDARGLVYTVRHGPRC